VKQPLPFFNKSLVHYDKRYPVNAIRNMCDLSDKWMQEKRF